MKKDEMIKKTALYDGVGVKVTDENGKEYYYFYANEGYEHGADRAFRNFVRGEKLDFFTQQKCRKILFEQYMQEYQQALEEVDEADRKYALRPYDHEAEENFIKKHGEVAEMLIVLCRRLMRWTGCSFIFAKKQVSSGHVYYDAF